MAFQNVPCRETAMGVRTHTCNDCRCLRLNAGTATGARITKQADTRPASRGAELAQRIILPDTQAIFRTGAARVLAMEEDMQVVAQCSDLPRLREAIGMLRDA